MSIQDLIDSVTDRERLGRGGFKPDLHPLDDQRHDQLEDQKIIIWYHFEEIEHDLWQVVHVNEDWAPMTKS